MLTLKEMREMVLEEIQAYKNVRIAFDKDRTSVGMIARHEIDEAVRAFYWVLRNAMKP